MSRLETTSDIENSLSVMLWGYSENTIFLHEKCFITREKENIFFPVTGIKAREGMVTCLCGKEDLGLYTSRKPVWEEFTLKEQLKIHETVKQECYQRRFGDYAYSLDVLAANMRKIIFLMGRKGEKYRFTESEAPRFYH